MMRQVTLYDSDIELLRKIEKELKEFGHALPNFGFVGFGEKLEQLLDRELV